MHSRAQQTTSDDALAPPPRSISTKITAGYDHIPIGTQLDVGFRDGDGNLVYYRGTVTKSESQTNGKVYTFFHWDDEASNTNPKWKGAAFDLTSQHHPVRRVDSPPPAPRAPQRHSVVGGRR